ncbi:MAG: hypothetical protein CSA62_07100 [Planctomycetota bacterium]|nr:MAG: hypothetical protein CSA62_07100 [Planctomycetota bacterium]
MQATLAPHALRRLAAAILSLSCCAVMAQEKKPAALFTNVSAQLGLGEVGGKTVVFTDLNGDGFHDIVLDRQRFFLSDKGKRFLPFEKHGIPFPEIDFVPVGRDGKPDRAKAKKRRYVPDYLYFADLDNDGDQDALWGVKAHWFWWQGTRFVAVKESDHGLRSQVLLNDGKGHFSKAPGGEYSSKQNAGAAMALAVLDYDHDGVVDLYEGREYTQYGVLFGCGVDRLWKGDQKGSFQDVTKAAGLLTIPQPGQKNSSRPSYGVSYADVNGDGRQDLLQLSYGRQWNMLWLNQGDGSFREFGIESGFAGDSITHGRYPDWLKKRMPGRRDEQPFRSNGNTFDCAVGDYDNDGDIDLFLGEIAHRWAGESSDLPALLINQGGKELRFERKNVRELLPPRKFRGQMWNYGDLHVAFLDYDNDMRLDLLIASGDYPDGQFLRLYRQNPDHSFEEVTKLAGFNWEGCGGISLGDYDRDGDVDILVGRSFMRLNKKHREQFLGGITVNAPGLFRNDVGNKNHWLNVRLVGKGEGGANRSGLGARIEVTAGGITQIRELRCGSGLSNHQDPPEACFGLGQNSKVEKLLVRWPDAKRSVQVFENLDANRFVLLRQGEKPQLSER